MHSVLAPASPPRKKLPDEEALSVAMSQKGTRTKVYSGVKNSGLTYVPSLFELSLRILQDNIDAIEYTGGVPYYLLKPVLERASAQQLYALEHFNPYLLDDTDELWQFLCKKEFKIAKQQEYESWRDVYLRCHEEREVKLKSLTQNIKQSMQKATPVRTTKLVYVDSVVKPPRNVARAQAKHGTSLENMKTIKGNVRPLEASLSGSANSIAAVAEPVRSQAPARASTSNAAAKKPKMAPLMQKTLKFIKNRYKR
uniref:EOG090X0BTZ n=1 Tax=Lynceus sp. MCZ IZ 141354 TaxID=1930659 RepID=A0A9N6WRH4_9CRUS|nr:EOG090X0BTZ [Lynceus sp. MCZ IZ 141354]